MSLSEAQIQQLEKRAKGFRRLIAALNDLNMYGIHQQIDKILFVKVDELKDHVKIKIKKNNDKLNEMYTESIDSLADDDGQQGEVAPVVVEDIHNKSIPLPDNRMDFPKE